MNSSTPTSTSSSEQAQETKPQNSTFPELIDNTAVSGYVKCPQYFFRSTIQGYRLKQANIHLTAGGALATALEKARRLYYEEKVSALEAEAAGSKALVEAYGTDEMEPAKTGDKSLDGVDRAFESYMLEYPLTEEKLKPIMLPNGKAAIEFSFAQAIPGMLHPETGNPLLYGGRFDWITEYSDTLFVADEKTTSSLGDQWRRQWDLDSQFTGYCWGAQSFGYPVAGAIIRGVGLLKTKITHAEVIIYRPRWVIDRWMMNLQYTVEDMIRDWKRNYYRYAIDKSSCASYGECAFKQVCESQNPTPWLNTHYEVKRWNPLERS